MLLIMFMIKAKDNKALVNNNNNKHASKQSESTSLPDCH